MSANPQAARLARELGEGYGYHHVRVALNVLVNVGGYDYDEAEVIVRALVRESRNVHLPHEPGELPALAQLYVDAAVSR